MLSIKTVARSLKLLFSALLMSLKTSIKYNYALRLEFIVQQCNNIDCRIKKLFIDRGLWW